MAPREHHRVRGWCGAWLGLLVAGCPVSALQQDQLAFACAHDYQCSQGYRCVEQQCRPTAALLDGAAVDGPGRDAAAEAGAPDRAGLDGGPTDAPVDASSPTDSTGALDAAPLDLPGAELSHPDSAAEDQAAADTAAPDTAQADSGELDAGAADTAQPDTTAPDTAVADTATEDAATEDAVVPDTAAPDTAAPDTAAPDTAAPDTSSPVDATPPCPGVPSSGPFCPTGEPALAACYTFDSDVDNGDGTWQIRDSSANGNHGTGSGIGYAAGHVGQALSMAGSGSVVVADSASLDVTPSMTLEAWVWLNAYPSSGRMAILDNNGQYGFFVYAGSPPFLRCSGGAQLLDGPAPGLQQWVHVACVNDDEAGERRLLIDGAVVATGPAAAPPTADTTPFDLGANSPDHDDSWNGALDQVRVWNSARTDAELCWAARQ